MIKWQGRGQNCQDSLIHNKRLCDVQNKARRKRISFPSTDLSTLPCASLLQAVSIQPLSVFYPVMNQAHGIVLPYHTCVFAFLLLINVSLFLQLTLPEFQFSLTTLCMPYLHICFLLLTYVSLFLQQTLGRILIFFTL